MLIHLVGRLQLAFLQVQIAALHLRLIRNWGQPVVKATNDWNMPETLRKC